MTRSKKGLKMAPTTIWVFFFVLLTAKVTQAAEEDCPWYGNPRVPLAIKANCLCARNKTSQQNQLSVQCHEVEGQQLVSILSATRQGSKGDPLELLYLNGSHVTDSNGQVPANLFKDLKLVSLQLSGCSIKSIHPEAFRGQEAHMKHLSLAQNQLTEVPVVSLERLTGLVLLDMSYNKITKVPHNAFHTLNKLSTLKLNDNNLEFDSQSFNGLEKSLRNLNLKATRISNIPEAIGNLSALAFLDLAQNRLRDLDPLPFVRLHSLTVLNLERNLLDSLPESVFNGVTDTLSSLSLLNNLITRFPKEALTTLHELRVLDLGFNLLTDIPQDAFTGLNSLTLLALDGNPLTTLPEASFQTLNTTLRGLSLGGRFLSCDCRIRWIHEWIHEHELQVTSRERNPQFCGSPPNLKPFNFYQIQPEDFKCDKLETTTTTTTTSTPKEDPRTAFKASPQDVPEKVRSNVQSLRPKLKMSPFQRPKKPEDQHQPQPQQPPASAPTDRESIYKRVHSFPGGTRSSSPSPPPPPESTEDIFASEYDTESDDNDPDDETHDAASTNQESVEKPNQVQTLLKPTNRRPFTPSSRTTTSTTTTTTTTTTPPPTTTTPAPTRRANSPSVIKPFPGVRAVKTQAKGVATISTVVLTDREPQLSSDTVEVVRHPPPTSTTQPPTISTTSRPTLVRAPSNGATSGRYAITESVGAPRRLQPSSSYTTVGDFDEAKIPVITGVGPARTVQGGTTSPNFVNTGSATAVRATTSYAPPPHTSSSQSHHSVVPPPQTSPSLHSNRPPNLIFADKPDIMLKNVERHGDSVFLQWESMKHVSGFRIIYRIFGEDSFRHGPALASTEKDFRVKNIPSNECVVVCVVPYEDILYNEISPSPVTIPPGSQCREIKPNGPSALMNNMDKITIGASAAICATVLVAVFLFILVTRRSKGKREGSNSGLITKIPPGSMASPSPGPQNIITPGSLGFSKEWDQQSAISVRSIPRARVYHGNQSMESGMMSGHERGTRSSGMHPQRQMPDGHSSHRSYLSSHHAHHNQSMHGHNNSHGGYNNHGGSGHAAPGGANSYLNNQSRLLRASVGSRSSRDALDKHFVPPPQHRQYEPNQKRRRPPGRISHSDSLNTLSGYETPDNWTDHDMDVYVARNPTRHDLVQL